MIEIRVREWEQAIQEPTWYERIVPEYKAVMALHGTDEKTYEAGKNLIYDFFEEHLLQGDIVLGSTGKDWDAERKPIDTVVVHHTSMLPGLSPSRLSGIELIRIYATQYASPDERSDDSIRGQPIYSGHFRNSKQIFWPYHWFVRKNGSVERLLNDDEIGWHSGVWEINKRSVGICFDGDFEYSKPSEAELSAVAKIIRENYSALPRDRIFGHCEVKEERTCPSKLFLRSSQNEGWKVQLLSLL